MNTPKKEDIIEELKQIPEAVLGQVNQIMRPWVMLFSALSRYYYLQDQLRKVTPRPVPTEPEEVKDESVQKDSN